MTVVGDILRAVVSGVADGQLFQNRYHYRVVSLGTLSDPADINQALIDRIQAVIEPAMILFLSDTATLTQYTAENLNSLTGDVSNSVSVPGLEVGDPSPTMVTLSYLLRPATKAIGVGRKSIGPLGQGITDGNDLEPTFLTSAATLAAAFQQVLGDPVSGATYAPVIASIPIGATRPYLPTAAQVIDVAFRGIGTQYTRKRGRGA